MKTGCVDEFGLFWVASWKSSKGWWGGEKEENCNVDATSQCGKVLDAGEC